MSYAQTTEYQTTYEQQRLRQHRAQVKQWRRHGRLMERAYKRGSFEFNFDAVGA